MIENDATRLAMLKAVGAVSVTHDGGKFWGVFDRAFALVDLGTGVESRAPAITCRTSDASLLSKDTVLTVCGDTYRIKQAQPDGTGISLLVLRQ